MPTGQSGSAEPFAAILRGGHPNSLGRTVEVVDAVLSVPERISELFRCYRDDDEVVRLRVSSAFKRLAAARPELVVPLLDGFLGEVAALDQPSAQWTSAQLFGSLGERMTPAQREAAVAVMQRNLKASGDWIVLIQTATTLTDWSAEDAALRAWLSPQLERLADDPRPAVAKRAVKLRRRFRGTA